MSAYWLTTWPHLGIPTYAQHDTEQQAAAHAHQIVASGTATVATYFEMGTDR